MASNSNHKPNPGPGPSSWFPAPGSVESSVGSLDEHSHPASLYLSGRGKVEVKPKCPECGKEYSNNSNLKQHIANVHSQSHAWETCPACCKQFKTRQYLQVHMLSSHGIRQRKSFPYAPQPFHQY